MTPAGFPETAPAERRRPPGSLCAGPRAGPRPGGHGRVRRLQQGFARNASGPAAQAASPIRGAALCGIPARASSCTCATSPALPDSRSSSRSRVSRPVDVASGEGEALQDRGSRRLVNQIGQVTPVLPHTPCHASSWLNLQGVIGHAQHDPRLHHEPAGQRVRDHLLSNAAGNAGELPRDAAAQCALRTESGDDLSGGRTTLTGRLRLRRLEAFIADPERRLRQSGPSRAPSSSGARHISGPLRKETK